jgi:hypothetical protein
MKEAAMAIVIVALTMILSFYFISGIHNLFAHETQETHQNIRR